MALRSNDVTAGELWDAGSRLPQHMVDLLRWRAALHPDRPAYIFLADGEHDEHRLTFADVDRLARRLAVELRERDLAGQRALLVYDPGLEYIIAFYGCLYAGVVAVPVYPPDPVRLNRVLPRLLSIVAQADARVLLSTRSILEWSVTFFGQAPQRRRALAPADDRSR